MNGNPDDDSSFDLADQVDRALHSFWRGSSHEFDRLLSDGNGDDTSVCGLLAGLIEENAHAFDVPERIGDYAISRQIGRGGMATVYEAKQERTGRIVALKLIHRWGSTDRARFRVFRREVDMLARLKHPSIATLYDAGITDDGQHYFAMELAGGLTLAQYMARRRADLSQAELCERLELFCKICRAMNYAHQRGVIHRDLKPSNIFVDPDGQPKILDFGLARLLENDPAVTASYSEGDRIVGTLQYMSPEQASGDPADLDIRSDVYSLGIILYEMLTGERPYPVRRMALPEAVRNICKTEPKRPGVMDGCLKGDPETIILKALEKEPERRYQSAAALAEDIERFLKHKPILARSPSAAYHLRKLVTRHKLPAVLIAALFAVTTIFVVIFVVQASQVVEQRDSARAAARKAEQINEFLARALASVNPMEVGSNVPVRHFLDKAAAGIDVELEGQLETQAALRDTLGRSYMALGLLDQAEEQLGAALECRRKVFGEHHPVFASSLHQMGLLARIQSGLGTGLPRKDHNYVLDVLQRAYEIRRSTLGLEHVDIAESLHDLADFYWESDMVKGERLLRDALAMRRKLLGEHRLVADSLHGLAIRLVAAGRYEEAQPTLFEALAMRRKLLGNDHFDVAITLSELGEIRLRRADYDGAEELYREQIRILSGIFGQEGHPELSKALSDLAIVQNITGAFVEAETHFRESIAMDERFHYLPALTKNNFAAFLCDHGRYEEAEPLAREVYRLWRGDAAEPNRGQGYAAQNLGMVLLERGEVGEAERLFLKAIGVWRTLFGEQHPKLARALIGLGRVRESRGENADARQAYLEAVDVRRNRLGEGNALTAEAMVYLAVCLHRLGEPGAEATLHEGIALIRNDLGERHYRVPWSLCRLADLQRADGGLDEADETYREAIEIERSIPRENHPVLASCLTGLAEILLTRGKFADAEPLLREALNIRETRYSAGDPRTAETQGLLGECMVELGSLDKAEHLLLKSYPVLAASTGPYHRLSERVRQQLFNLYQSIGEPDLARPYALHSADLQDRALQQAAEPVVSGESRR